MENQARGLSVYAQKYMCDWTKGFTIQNIHRFHSRARSNLALLDRLPVCMLWHRGCEEKHPHDLQTQKCVSCMSGTIENPESTPQYGFPLSPGSHSRARSEVLGVIVLRSLRGILNICTCTQMQLILVSVLVSQPGSSYWYGALFGLFEALRKCSGDCVVQNSVRNCRNQMIISAQLLVISALQSHDTVRDFKRIPLIGKPVTREPTARLINY